MPSAHRDADLLRDLGLRTLSARSVLLSVLLGQTSSSMSVTDLLAWVSMYGVSEPTARVTLTRMAAGGDVSRADGVVSLTKQHSERRRQQAEHLAPSEKKWTGDWVMAVVTVIGLAPPERSLIRERLAHLRMAEVRDTVWARPHNLVMPTGTDFPEHTLRIVGSVSRSAHELVQELWDLQEWASRATQLAAALAATSDALTRLTIGAAALRHLGYDPVLPAELQPSSWPSADLRQAYTEFRRREHPPA